MRLALRSASLELRGFGFVFFGVQGFKGLGFRV